VKEIDDIMNQQADDEDQKTPTQKSENTSAGKSAPSAAKKSSAARGRVGSLQCQLSKCKYCWAK